MPRPKSSTDRLSQLADATEQPIYAIDERQRIVFINAACAAWLGVAAEKLLGQECRYHSRADVASGERITAALCPPPHALAGQRMTGEILAASADPAESRHAEFIPLSGPDGKPAGVMVFVDDGVGSGARRIGRAPNPAEPEDLHLRLQRIRSRRANRYQIDRLLGSSPAIRQARAQAGLAAMSDVSVLIIGPPGSGRQHMARTIHYQQWGDRDALLIPLACSLLGADLLRSAIAALGQTDELAGAPARGTLLLSNVDALPVELHRELGECLQGDFPLRVMATAQRRLDELVESGRYDTELAAVLSTLVVDMPALAGRIDDLALLAQAALEDENSAGAKQLQGFSHAALDRLAAFHWPGNMDELYQVIQQSHRQAAGPLIEEADLPHRIRVGPEGAVKTKETTIVLDDFLNRIEIELIERAMKRAKGNKARAARLLGLTRPRLYRRLRQLGLADGAPADESAGET